MAGICIREQAAISFSGREEPSRKLKAEREWSSTYICKRIIYLSRRASFIGEESAFSNGQQIPRAMPRFEMTIVRDGPHNPFADFSI
jgi:hypothetical protein